MTRAAILAVLFAATTAHADKKIQGMTPGFSKELSACQIEMRGLARMVTGATNLVATLQGTERTEIEADLAALTAANTTMTSYCTEVEGMVKFLEANAAVAYKSVEKEIDTRDNTVRKLRKEAKKKTADIAPITRKLIPRIKRTPAPDPTAAPKPVATIFPSKRKVVLPELGEGGWVVSGSATSDIATYADKTSTTTVTSRPFDKMSCDQQRKAFAERSATPAADLEVSAAGKAIAVAWSSRLVTTSKPARSLLAMCVERGMGGVMVIADVVPAGRKTFDAELAKLMVAMLAVQVEGKK
ncbi:MAG: hypothetical protein ACKV2T_31245 [Kofleriaceae bacterium]